MNAAQADVEYDTVEPYPLENVCAHALCCRASGAGRAHHWIASEASRTDFVNAEADGCPLPQVFGARGAADVCDLLSKILRCASLC